MPVAWDELAALSLARQFPVEFERGPIEGAVEGAVEGVSPAAVVEVIGPIQSQAARAPFLGLLARAPSLARESIVQAYTSSALVRGSTVRGTVHTCTPLQQVLLDVLTRIGQRPLFERSLRLRSLSVEQVWAEVEDFAGERWRSSEELIDELRRLVGSDRGTAPDAPDDVLDTQLGRYLGFGAGGLVRRPATGGWDGQGRAEYRTARVVHGLCRPADTDAAMAEAISTHVRCHGPVSRNDIAWWSGLGLRAVDAALDRLELTRDEGPLGRVYVDLPGARAPRELPGVRLLPEFDALLCGYDAKARDRFVRPDRHAVLASAANGLMSPPLLVDGEVTGWWRLTGSGRRRTAEVHWFTGTRRPRKADLTAALDQAARALDVEVVAVMITREQT